MSQSHIIVNFPSQNGRLGEGSQSSGFRDGFWIKPLPPNFRSWELEMHLFCPNFSQTPFLPKPSPGKWTTPGTRMLFITLLTQKGREIMISLFKRNVLSPDGFEKEMIVVNGQYPGPTIDGSIERLIN
jgi:hypothetical protein